MKLMPCSKNIRCLSNKKPRLSSYLDEEFYLARWGSLAHTRICWQFYSQEMRQVLKQPKSLADRNIHYFYLITAFGDAWFIKGVWVFFMREYISYQQIVLVELVGIIVGMCAEVPSGALADMLGRKKVAFAGYTIMSISVILPLLGVIHPLYFFIGTSCLFIGMSFVSGSVEALIYDSLVSEGKQSKYAQVIGRSKSYQIWGLSSAVFLGGLAWHVHHFLPWALTCLFFTIAALCVTQLHEAPHESKNISLQTMKSQINVGFHSLFNRKNAATILVLYILGLSYVLWSWEFIRLLMGESFGYAPGVVSYLLGFSLFVASLAAFKLDSLRHYLGEYTNLLLLFIVGILSWTVAVLPNKSMLLGAIVFLAFATTGKLGQAWQTIIINRHVHSTERATAFSMYSLLQKLFQILIIAYLTFGFSSSSQSSSQSLTLFNPLYFLMSVLLLAGFILLIFTKGTVKTKEQGHLDNSFIC